MSAKESSIRFEGSDLDVPYVGAVGFDNEDRGVREQTTLNDRLFEQTRIDDKRCIVPRECLLSFIGLLCKVCFSQHTIHIGEKFQF